MESVIIKDLLEDGVMAILRTYVKCVTHTEKKFAQRKRDEN